jgi:NADPH:quinone reductase-like Zn-dependent oxidoreductase
VIAAVARAYGPPEVIELRERPAPAVGPAEVRVRVRAASLNPLDAKLRAGALRPFLRLRFPAVLGFDLAGEVEAVGARVRGFSPGERVYGRSGARTGGTHAELASVAAGVRDRVPARLSFEQAASLPLTGMTAIQALRDVAGLRAGQRLLVHGAAGGVGVAAVQVGRALGATVTGVASGGSASLVARLGAARVLDYTRGDLERETDRYDVILDAVANRPWPDFARILAEGGTYVTTGFTPSLALRAALGRLRRPWSRPRVRLVVSRADGGLMRALSGYVERGALEPVIDSVWPLARIRDAYRRLETGHAHGKVVVTIP